MDFVSVLCCAVLSNVAAEATVRHVADRETAQHSADRLQRQEHKQKGKVAVCGYRQ
jgi:hypothetical protein